MPQYEVRDPNRQHPVYAVTLHPDLAMAISRAGWFVTPLEPFDPLNTPIPCDVTVGHVTMRQGVALRTLVMRMKVLYDLAFPERPDETLVESLRIVERAQALMLADPNVASQFNHADVQRALLGLKNLTATREQMRDQLLAAGGAT